MTTVSLSCPSCKKGFQVPEDERLDHSCPHCGFGDRPETCGIDACGEEILEDDEIVVDPNNKEIILKSNLEEYLTEMYGFKFQVAK